MQIEPVGRVERIDEADEPVMIERVRFDELRARAANRELRHPDAWTALDREAYRQHRAGAQYSEVRDTDLSPFVRAADIARQQRAGGHALARHVE